MDINITSQRTIGTKVIQTLKHSTNYSTDSMLLPNFFSLSVLLFLVGNISGGWYGNFSDYRPFRIRTTRFICSGHENNHHVTIHECNLKLLRNDSSVINFNATILKPIKPVWVSIRHMYKTNAHIYHPMLGIDGAIELCQYLSQGTGGNAFTEAVRRMAKRYVPHLLKPCPIVVSFAVWVLVPNYFFHFLSRVNTALQISSTKRTCFHRFYQLETGRTTYVSSTWITRHCSIFNFTDQCAQKVPLTWA